MSITSKGYAGTVDYADWAMLTSHLGAQYSVFGQDAFSAIPGAGTREIIIQPGRAAGQGILDDSSDAVTLTGANVGAGSRWDLVALRRDWATNESTLVLIQGGPTQAIPERSIGAGDKDDQPLFLARFAAGQTAVQEFVDLRCWHGDGGGLVARSLLARDYLTRIGTRVRIQGISWLYAWDGSAPGWVSDSVSVSAAQPPYIDGHVWVVLP